MTQFNEIRGNHADWVRPAKNERRFELRIDDGAGMVLAFRSGAGSLARAECARGAWSFKRIGFLAPHITIRHLGGERDIAVYQPRFWGGGTVRFEDGTRFIWKSAGVWKTTWSFMSPTGAALIRFRPGTVRKLRDVEAESIAAVEIERDVAGHVYLEILLGLGMYLLDMQEEENNIAVLAAAIS